jgi:hypothetical protein
VLINASIRYSIDEYNAQTDEHKANDKANTDDSVFASEISITISNDSPCPYQNDRHDHIHSDYYGRILRELASVRVPNGLRGKTEFIVLWLN